MLKSLRLGLMSCTPLRFGLALCLAGVLALAIILMMQSFIDEYDTVASDAIVRVFKLQTVSLTDDTDDADKAVPYGEYSDAEMGRDKNPEHSEMAAKDAKSEALQEILRKKNEMIAILEEAS